MAGKFTAKLREKTRALVYSRLENKTRFKHYKWVEISDVSRDCIYTIVMSEDSSFFDHDGIDVEAILSSMAENMKMIGSTKNASQHKARHSFAQRAEEKELVTA